MTVSFRSASIFASLAGAAASVLMLVAVATDHWEKAEYSIERLKAIANVNVNASYFDVQNGFYKLVETKTELASVSPSNAPGNATITVHVSVRYVRANYGGIWKICDRVSGGHNYCSANHCIFRCSWFIACSWFIVCSLFILL